MDTKLAEVRSRSMRSSSTQTDGTKSIPWQIWAKRKSCLEVRVPPRAVPLLLSSRCPALPEIDHTAVDQYRSGVARLEPGGIILCRESTVRGETETRAGEYLGVAPAGRQIVWTSIQIDLIENGRIVESWVDWDKYRFFQGLGLV